MGHVRRECAGLIRRGASMILLLTLAYQAVIWMTLLGLLYVTFAAALGVVALVWAGLGLLATRALHR